jgi:hypothetical protein
LTRVDTKLDFCLNIFEQAVSIVDRTTGWMSRSQARLSATCGALVLLLMKSDYHSVSTICGLLFGTVKLLADREFADNPAAQADLSQVSPLFAFNDRCHAVFQCHFGHFPFLMQNVPHYLGDSGTNLDDSRRIIILGK